MGALASPLAGLPASDGDGIPDVWKLQGVNVTTPDGKMAHLDLGAKPGEKDVIVFVAWMVGFDGHSHKPIAGPGDDNVPLGRAYTALKNIVTPDGKQNTRLIVIQAALPIQEHLNKQIMELGTTNDAGTEYKWDAFDQLKKQYFYQGPPGIDSVIHFCIFAHQLGGVDMSSYSGIARGIPAKDYIVALGSVPNQSSYADQQVGTFLHELGHDLGLHHGGSDEYNSKPNYPSVMNYMFQLNGTIYDGQPGIYTYSSVDVDLNENELIEKNGISPNQAYAKYGSILQCPVTEQVGSYNDPIHWNCSDTSDQYKSDPYALDINQDTHITDLPGYNDWQHLIFDTRAGTAPAPVPVNTEPNLRNVARQAGVFAPSVTVGVKDNALVLSWKKIPLQAVKGYQVYRTTNTGPAYLPIGSTTEGEYLDRAVEKNTNYVYTVRSILEDDFQKTRVVELHSFPTQYSDLIVGGGRAGVHPTGAPRLMDLTNTMGWVGALASEEPAAVQFPTLGKPSKPVSAMIR